ncbi:gliding motility-associated C-terminal domain-containing protein [Paucihalobacter ruber]|uniref:Gliding motility-associated C-terminal domain-containing protein n=1 Tax=Paucihalobacter ruber TaxID=2567861 RepID=A0A506PG56_9FLAO|nr:gliding motility-associated C-terminal domain-containing protein [Paucihalobacter ruber]TPV32851.1 gliding motility-associated C-terminal domain-containing protein [Paucihalobacter ruber]
MKWYQTLSVFLSLTVFSVVSAQDVSLYQQFNGRYDYTAIGNTMNTSENGPFSVCEILTTSSATLNLTNSQTIVAAYLYWAGSGPGDFEVQLNEVPISAERTFTNSLDASRIFFAAFAEVTNLVLDTGDGDYTLSNLDLTEVIAPYCPSGTNFAGWSIIIIFEDENLPLNQVNVYDGLQSVPNSLTITLDNLNVLDTEGAKIGFLAWEGDAALAVNETLSINGIALSNPPLNPINNAFNSTNSFTGSNELWNMDIDVYNIQNFINIGDDSAIIELTSGQDFVMINNIITVLNSQLPDATITINDVFTRCNIFDIEVEFEVFNLNSTDILPSGTPIAFYADDRLIGQSATNNDIAISASESGLITLTIPEDISPEFTLRIAVDDDGTGNGMVTELDESNNSISQLVALNLPPDIVTIAGATACNEGFEVGTFDLWSLILGLPDQNEDNYSFFENLEELYQNINPIYSAFSFNNQANPQKIYIKHLTASCFEVFETDLTVENCPPRIPEGFSPNNDGLNDWFNIQGLYDIFVNHELLIFNRYGTLIFVGDNNQPWNGVPNRGLNGTSNVVPQGSYYYILKLRDPNYKDFKGWITINY